MTPRRAGNLWLSVAALLLGLIGGGGSVNGRASADDAPDDDEPPPRRPGLIARVSVGEHTFERVAATATIDDVNQPFDRRLDPATKYSVRWSGLLSIQADGKYALFADAASGHVRIALNGREVLNRTSAGAALHVAEPIELEFGQPTIEVEFEPMNRPARLALFWSGPGFSMEPLAERHFSHEPSRSPPRDFERGERLVRALRCGACHSISGEPPPLPAPALDKLAGNLNGEWLVDWLLSGGHGDLANHPVGDNIARRMPMFGLARDEAVALANYLLPHANPPSSPAPAKSLGNPRDGETLFHTLGCLACHRLGELGQHGLFDGGDLARIGTKRPAAFFTRWLAEPNKLNGLHRMPVFELSEPERSDLAAFLTSLPRSPGPRPHPSPLPRGEGIGQKLFERVHCAACHVGPGTDKVQALAGPRLGDDSNWNHACTGEPETANLRPGYRLAAKDAAAVRAFITRLPNSVVARPNFADGRRLLVEHNCVACHARDLSPGLAPALTAVAESKPELGGLVSAMTPPSLASVGDKLRDDALVAAIRRSAGNHRPYLHVRMPKFSLSDEELAAVVSYLVAADRLPESVVAIGVGQVAGMESGTLALREAGPRLVTSDGLGCTSCHQIGKALPVKAPVNARGPDLTLPEKRIRREWFDRWCRDPARIVPRMEMPAVKVAVRGVLDESVDNQLAAIWHVLNVPGFQPPEPTVQILRLSGIRERNERAETITDVVHADGQTFVRPVLIGLPNRNNILFDCETAHTVRWSFGDIARQRTQGKTWFWEAEGTDLLKSGIDSAEIIFEHHGQQFRPVSDGHSLAKLTGWELLTHGVALQYRLAFTVEGVSFHIDVDDHWMTGKWIPGHSGIRRAVVLRGSAPFPLSQARLRILSQERLQAVLVAPDGHSLEFRDTHVVLKLPPSVAAESRFVNGALPFQSTTPREASAGLDYEWIQPAELPPLASATPLVTPEPPTETQPTPMTMGPGLIASRLPLPLHEMPTAFAWRSDGTLVVASLKGRIWWAEDSDGDGLEDRWKKFSDNLAAPYGLAAEQDFVDVCTKFALLRLFDEDGDGRAERTETIASGWGYTDDYHDWTIGLPKDEQGNYYIGLACQQDKRSAAAAHLRGTVVKLVPREPTDDDPLRFKLEPISGGHRFPMGLARNRAGDLFVTDNQGNYNPFNELNHVRPGKRYGFINTSERTPDFKPLAEPAAIEIPHPWTRSVNGICFLETPDKVRRRLGRDLFGPYEGHLIGCEYDTRRLIRMSLQKIGDTYQGAAYPLSPETPPAGSEMLGPVCCAVSPAGDIYVGSLRDSGWGAGNNIGEVIRIRPQFAELPPGIREVRAATDGFEIDFAAPVDPLRAADPANYSLSSYRRASTPAYGGPDEDRRDERIAALRVSSNARHVHVQLPELRPGFVYDIRLKNLAGTGRTFFPAEAYFTLHRIP